MRVPREQRWRRENSIDTILEDFEFTEKKEFAAAYRQGYHRTDKMGRPIYIEKLEGVSYERLIAISSEERVMKKTIQEYEKLMKIKFPACSLMAGRHIDQSFSILDVGGIKIKDFNKDLRRMLKNLLGLASDNYPEVRPTRTRPPAPGGGRSPPPHPSRAAVSRARAPSARSRARQTMGKMFIINAPTIFTIIWTFVKRVVDPRTVAKIDVMGTNYLPKLLMYIDAENLPVQFGGLDTTPWPEAEPGPWDVYVKDAHVHGNNIRHLFRDDADTEDRVKPRMFSDAPPPAEPRPEKPAALSGIAEGEEPAAAAKEEAADGGDSLLARIGLLEQECARYKALLLSSPRDFKGQHPPGSILGRLEVLEQAMVEIRTAQRVATGEAPQTPRQPSPRHQAGGDAGAGAAGAAAAAAGEEHARCHCAVQ